MFALNSHHLGNRGEGSADLEWEACCLMGIHSHPLIRQICSYSIYSLAGLQDSYSPAQGCSLKRWRKKMERSSIKTCWGVKRTTDHLMPPQFCYCSCTQLVQDWRRQITSKCFHMNIYTVMFFYVIKTLLKKNVLWSLGLKTILALPFKGHILLLREALNQFCTDTNT